MLRERRTIKRRTIKGCFYMRVVADWRKVQCKAKGKLQTVFFSRFWQKPPTGSIDIRSEADFFKSA